MKSIPANWARRMKGLLTASSDDHRFLTGRLLCTRIRELTKIRSLADVEFRLTSQWGEDGIIDWLVERLGVQTHAFIEFGSADYRESNTRFLLQNRNWRGLVLDSDQDNIDFVSRGDIYWRHDLEARCAFVRRDNINELIASAGFSGEVGLLSIDVDGNDYWIWEAIQQVNPVICVVEYNAVFGDVKPLSVPYDPNFRRTEAHFSNLYFGTSIAALRLLGSRKGYRYVGTNSAGVNAFFVRNDYASLLDGAIVDLSPRCSRLRESRSPKGALTHLSGLRRLDPIAHLPIVNVETGQTMELGRAAPLYSEEWIKAMRVGSIPPTL